MNPDQIRIKLEHIRSRMHFENSQHERRMKDLHAAELELLLELGGGAPKRDEMVTKAE